MHVQGLQTLTHITHSTQCLYCRKAHCPGQVHENFTMLSSCLRNAVSQLALVHHVVRSSQAIQAGALAGEAPVRTACRQLLSEQAVCFPRGSLWQSDLPCMRHAFSSAARSATGSSHAAPTSAAEVRIFYCTGLSVFWIWHITSNIFDVYSDRMFLAGGAGGARQDMVVVAHPLGHLRLPGGVAGPAPAVEGAAAERARGSLAGVVKQAPNP